MPNNFKVTTNMPPVPEGEGNSLLNFFDQENADINLFNLVDDELIKISGSELYYYKYFQSEEFDDVYLESRNKPIASDPILVHGHYEPKALEENLSEFGIELTNDQLFIFNKSSIEAVLGRTPIPFDVVQPKFQNIKYELFEVQEESFEIYGVYHIVCAARVLRDSHEVVQEPLTKRSEQVSVREVDPRIAESPLADRQDLTNPYGDRS